MNKPNRKAEEAGHTLSTVIATNITNALDHLARELSVCDGFGERGDTVAVATSAGDTSTERAMLARYELTEMRESLTDDLTAALDAIRKLGWTAQAAMRLRAPHNAVQPNTAKLCRDGITDKTRQGSIEWHDPTCMMPSAKLGLCQRHYDARRYWLTTNGVQLEDEQDIVVGVVHSTMQVIVHDGVGGAAHVRPAIHSTNA